MTLKEFYFRFPLISNAEEVNEQIKALPKPLTLAKKTLPDNLDGITFGELVALQNAVAQPTTDFDRFAHCATILLNVMITDEESAEDFFGFAMWVTKELTRISALFDSIKTPPTEEEKQAGVERLNFGFFGTIDWYCKRMGISDHSQAESVPWQRVFMCMKIDNETAQYERRLREVYARKQR